MGAHDERTGGLEAGGIFTLLLLLGLYNNVGLRLRSGSDILVIGEGERLNRDFSTSFATLNVFVQFFSQIYFNCFNNLIFLNFQNLFFLFFPS